MATDHGRAWKQDVEYRARCEGAALEWLGSNVRHTGMGGYLFKTADGRYLLAEWRNVWRFTWLPAPVVLDENAEVINA